MPLPRWLPPRWVKFTRPFYKLSVCKKNPSFPSNSFSASQGGPESMSGQAPSRKLLVTLLSSEWQSTKGGLSTINRELAIQLAKHPNVEVSMYLPRCSEEDVKIAERYHVNLVQARQLIGYEPTEWLSYAPENHEIDYVIGHGLLLGRQVQLIQRVKNCKWVQVVHTAPEDLGMFKGYANAISRAEERHKMEIELCVLADEVVAVGPKLADAYSRYLRHCQRDQSVFVLTPSIFSEFSLVEQAAEERRKFCVLVFGLGDTEDFELKGYDIAAKAISELIEESYQLVFVGAPLEKEEEVAKRLCQHGIARRQLTVRSFNESREDLVRLFCEVDLCIMPSRTEGFGLAALEALSAGLPILVSGNSGLGDALQNVPHGSTRVVNSEDPREWANAIKSVRQKRRGVRLRETKDLCIQYAEEYSWEKQCYELVGRMLRNIFARLQIQIDVKCVTKRSAQESTGMEVHPREPQEIVQEARVPSNGLATENSGNIISQSMRAVLTKIADKYFQDVNPSNEEQCNGFVGYLKEVRKVVVLDVKPGSLIITVEVGSEKILEELWKDYRKGHLDEVAQKFLVTEELLEECGLIQLKLTIHIAEEEYKACKQYFCDLIISLPDYMGQNPRNQSGDRGDEPAPAELQQRINELEGQLRQRSVREEELQQRINELEGRQLVREEELQQRINALEGQLPQRSRMEEELRQLNNELERQIVREEELQQRINELEGQLTQRSSTEELQRRINELERQIIGEEELQQRINGLEGQLRQNGTQLPTMDWVINRNDIQITSHELGRGGWGVVYRGRFHYYDVAVKKMYEDIVGNSRHMFEREVNMASKCRHPSLLLVIGATKDEGPPLLVTELLECSLWEKLYPSPGELPVENEQAISLDVAYALRYLHEKANPILHKDVSSSKVLLWKSGNDWRAKLSDYGTANFVHRCSIKYAGAAVYCAPEYMRRENRASCKADVYSYGVLLCELRVRKEPNREQLQQQIDRIEKHDPCSPIRRLVRSCVNEVPGNRPSMDVVIKALTNSFRSTYIGDLMIGDYD